MHVCQKHALQPTPSTLALTQEPLIIQLISTSKSPNSHWSHAHYAHLPATGTTGGLPVALPALRRLPAMLLHVPQKHLCTPVFFTFLSAPGSPSSPEAPARHAPPCTPEAPAQARLLFRQPSTYHRFAAAPLQWAMRPPGTQQIHHPRPPAQL
eukprot:1140394-Pelagomonas_calceolata.AAC.5